MSAPDANLLADASRLQALFDRQRAAFASSMNPSLSERLDRLHRLKAMTTRIAEPMVAAIAADFGTRPRQVTMLADVLVTREAIAFTTSKLKGWMRSRRMPTSASYWPGHSRLAPQPLGVVGIVSPWNYPYQLAMVPAVSALAAGNRVMIKPSELTPRFAALLQQAIAEAFEPDEMSVVVGGVDVARAFTALPFDHLLFTGSTATGRQVAASAAEHLTPVTLELGGKSPAIVNADCDLAQAVPRLVMGKLFNAGQTCIAPDYALVPHALLPAFEQAVQRATSALYPRIAGNGDYTSIVDEHHRQRLQSLLDDARAQGATVVPMHTETQTEGRQMPPVMVLGVTPSMRLAREEIFGPILPVVTYSTPAEAIAYVNAGERPLALYWFGRSASDRDRVLAQTISGGVTVNDCFWHIAQQSLPFGGVGASGMGSYHGVHGFRTFSHEKPVFEQSRYSGLSLAWPPYGRAVDLLLRAMSKRFS